MNRDLPITPGGTFNLNEIALGKSGGAGVYEVAGVRDPYAERDKYFKMVKKNPSDGKARRLFEFWDRHIKRFYESPKMPPAWS